MRIGEDTSYNKFSILLTQGGDSVAHEDRRFSENHRCEFVLVVSGVTTGDVVLKVSELTSSAVGLVNVVDRNGNSRLYNQPVVSGVFQVTIPASAVGQGTVMTGVFF